MTDAERELIEAAMGLEPCVDLNNNTRTERLLVARRLVRAEREKGWDGELAVRDECNEMELREFREKLIGMLLSICQTLDKNAFYLKALNRAAKRLDQVAARLRGKEASDGW